MNDKIICLECGLYFKSLPGHLFFKHGMSSEEYKRKHQIRISDGLVCCSVRKKLCDHASKLYNENKIGTEEQREKAHKKIKTYKKSKLSVLASKNNAAKRDMIKVGTAVANANTRRERLNIVVSCSCCESDITTVTGAYGINRVPVCIKCQNNRRNKLRRENRLLRRKTT